MLCPYPEGRCVGDRFGPPKPTKKPRYMVLATDYNNYAIVYSCYTAYAFSYDIVWIMSRTVDPKDWVTIENKLNETLPSYDFRKDFHLTKHDDCEEGEYIEPDSRSDIILTDPKLVKIKW